VSAPDASIFSAGIARFNRGEFFEAHEEFEARLDDVEDDDRWDLLVALIQVAVGYHKAQSGYDGAARMLRLGLEKLEPFAATASGIQIGALRQRVGEDLARAEAGEPLAARLAEAPPRIVVGR
jgi:predicted metal-dependent hydrolase